MPPLSAQQLACPLCPGGGHIHLGTVRISGGRDASGTWVSAALTVTEQLSLHGHDADLAQGAPLGRTVVIALPCTSCQRSTHVVLDDHDGRVTLSIGDGTP